MFWYDIKKLLSVSIFYDVMSSVKVVEKMCVYKKICGVAACIDIFILFSPFHIEGWDKKENGE